MKFKYLSLTTFVSLSAISFLSKDYFFARLHINTDLGTWVFAVSVFIITLLCLWLDKQKLSYIGLNLSPKNLSYFIFGIFVATIFAFFGIFLTGLTIHLNYGINPKPDYLYIFKGLFSLIFPYIIIEELLLRGFAYRKTIELTNLTIANSIFCVYVVVAHWFWWEVWGQPQRMFLATITASGHLMLSYAFLKSQTIYLPIALHLFGNWAANYLISSNIPSKSVFVIDASQAISRLYQPYINWGVGILVNLLTMIVVYFWFQIKHKQSRP